MSDHVECACESCGLEFLIREDLIDEIEDTQTCPACQEPAHTGGVEFEDYEDDEYPDDDGDGDGDDPEDFGTGPVGHPAGGGGTGSSQTVEATV